MATEKEYLVLSRLAYYNFNERKDVGQAINEIAYSGPTSEGISQWQNDIDQMGNWQLVNYVNKNGASGYCGAAFKNTVSGEIVIANRGTEPPTNADLMTDLNFIFLNSPLGTPKQIVDALHFTEQTLANESGRTVDHSDLSRFVNAYKVSFTGHSLGGGLAQYQTYLTGGKAVTFNALGIGQAMGMNELNAAKYNVLNIVNGDDFIGNYGIHLGEVRTINGNLWKDESKFKDYSTIDRMTRVINLCAQGKCTKVQMVDSLMQNLELTDKDTRDYIMGSFRTKAHGLEEFKDHIDEYGRVLKGVISNNTCMKQLDDAFLNLATSISSGQRYSRYDQAVSANYPQPETFMMASPLSANLNTNLYDAHFQRNVTPNHAIHQFDPDALKPVNSMEKAGHNVAFYHSPQFSKPSSISLAGENNPNMVAGQPMETTKSPDSIGARPNLQDIIMNMRNLEKEQERLKKEHEQYKGEALTREKAEQQAKSSYVNGEDKHLAQQIKALQTERAQLQKEEVRNQNFGRENGVDGPLGKYIPNFLKSDERKSFESNTGLIQQKNQELDQREAKIAANMEKLQERLQTPEARAFINEKVRQYLKQDEERLTKLEHTDKKLGEVQKEMVNNIQQSMGLPAKQGNHSPEQSMSAWQRITDIMNVEPRPAIPGTEKLLIGEAREYRIQAKAIIEREGYWPGQAADAEVASNMYVKGYSKERVSLAFMDASPETVNNTINQGIQYGRDIAAQAFTPNIQISSPSHGKSM